MDFRVSLPLPLFDRAQGRKRTTRAMADIARFDRVTIEQGLLERWSVAEARIAAAAEQVEAYRVRILPKAEKALQLVKRGYDAGRFDLLDLLDIQRTTAESKMAYYDKLFELHAAGADLESLLPPEDRNTEKGNQE
jgi:cobalt-zinc-cadmium efflux system outer membrane protein